MSDPVSLSNAMYYSLRSSYLLQGPACRSPICSGKLFTRAAFVPSDADLLPGNENPEADSNMEMEDCTISAKDRKGKGKPKRAARRLILDSDDVTVSEAESDDEEVGDDMGDFIVEDDEDEEEKDARRELKKRLGKRKALVVLDSDEEREETPEESEVLFGARKAPASDGAIKLMPRFLPSTKMKVGLTREGGVQCCYLVSLAYDEATSPVGRRTSRRKGLC